MQIPNGMGTLLGLVQLILYFCYYGSTPVAAPAKIPLMS